MLTKLNEKESKIDVCELKDKSPWLNYSSYPDQVIYFTLIELETFLPLRVSERNAVGVLNLIRASCQVGISDRESGLVSANCECKDT